MNIVFPLRGVHLSTNPFVEPHVPYSLISTSSKIETTTKVREVPFLPITITIMAFDFYTLFVAHPTMALIIDAIESRRGLSRTVV